MNPQDYIYDQIYKGCLRSGATERQAQQSAVMGLDSWKKGKFKKVTDLIKQTISDAKKVTR